MADVAGLVHLFELFGETGGVVGASEGSQAGGRGDVIHCSLIPAGAVYEEDGILAL